MIVLERFWEEREYIHFPIWRRTAWSGPRRLLYSAWVIELNTKNSTRWQQSCHLVEFLVFNSAFGRHRHWLIPITSYSFIIIVMSFIIYQLTGKWSNLPQVGSLSSDSIDDERHDDDDEWVWCDRYKSVPVSAEGRVEHQKLNQVAAELPPDWFLVFNSTFGR